MLHKNLFQLIPILRSSGYVLKLDCDIKIHIKINFVRQITIYYYKMISPNKFIM